MPLVNDLNLLFLLLSLIEIVEIATQKAAAKKEAGFTFTFVWLVLLILMFFLKNIK